MGSGVFGIGGSDSTSSVDQHQLSGDAGINLHGNNSRVNAPGSHVIDLGQSRVNSGLQNVSAKGNIVIGDTQAISNLASQFASTISGVAQSSQEALTNALAQQSSTVQDALGKVTDVSNNAATGGDSSRNKIILYIVLGLLATVGAIFYFRSK